MIFWHKNTFFKKLSFFLVLSGFKSLVGRIYDIPEKAVLIIGPNSFKYFPKEEIDKISKPIREKKNKEPDLIRKLIYKIRGDKSKIEEDRKFESDPESLTWHENQGKFKSQIPEKYSNAEKFIITTKDNAKIEVFFHNRKSDRLIIVFPGFNNLHYSFLPFLGMFPDYDILFVNFRGSLVNAWNITKKVLCVNPRKTTLGAREYLDVIAATDSIKYLKIKRTGKPYKTVIAHGMCFGGAMATIAQSKKPDLFDLIIADSIWPDSKLLTANFLQDIGLVFRPQKNPGGIWYYLGQVPGMKNILAYLIQNYFFKRKFPNINVCEYLQKIHVPMLLFYGIGDLLISPEDISKVFDNIPHLQKTLIVTKSKHLLSFLKYQDFYQMMVTEFIKRNSK